MVGTPTRTALACALVAGALLLYAASSGAIGATDTDEHSKSRTVHHVSPGRGTPIQDAVDRARPGDTVFVHPGHYRESVSIDKPLTVLGSGMTEGGSLLTPPREPQDSACQDVSGFCVGGRIPYTRPKVSTRIVGHVTIKGFRVRGFRGSGVIGLGTDRLLVENVHAEGNREYGIASFASTRTVLTGNTATGSGDAGVYLGDSPDAAARIGDNRASGNAVGIMIRDATGMTAARNTATGNCIGIVALNTGRGAVPGGRLNIRDNAVHRNTRACPARGDTPATSGVGIALAGVHDVHVHRNDVRHNAPTGPSIATGGIAVFSTEPRGGATPRDNRVVQNVALDNRPVGLFWDRTGHGNVFSDNQHRMSSPSDLG
ncbi:right-handed parallel beta-helix repeat-containing protein [Streptomyces sp. KR80]|uniref:right-handed parallel beta-helix repeat-containing protein n=1 Tax=Streptomyces sp. KR80 TaxID=3457426 RepID=UPI003FD2EFD7